MLSTPKMGNPLFLAEWLNADESLNILVKSCLCLLQNAFSRLS